jgi:CheY-like chemotaxis protein
MDDTRKKILVADDDPAILEVITFMLEDAGYEVVTTVGGDTEKCVQESKPDLLLLDIWMSGMDGRNICKNLKSRKATMHMPIIMISANKDTKKIAKEVGANDFISKPFEMKTLLSLVKKYTSS